MCATCGCGKSKDKHGMKTLAAANNKFSKTKKLKKQAAIAISKKSSMNRKKGM
jgi:hypothetical protein